MDEKVLDRLRKLLAMGGSSNENEAAMAMKLAQKLAIEHDLDIARVGLTADDEIVRDDRCTGKKRTLVQKYINWILREFFKVRVLWSRVWDPKFEHRVTEMTLVGSKCDIPMAWWVHDFLNLTFPALWKAYKRQSGADVSSRGSFYLGAYGGLYRKLAAQREEIVGDSADSYALVVRSHWDRLKSAEGGFFTKIKTVSETADEPRDLEALENGVVAGQTIELHRQLEGREVLALEGGVAC